jgi:hypothetical protein
MVGQVWRSRSIGCLVPDPVSFPVHACVVQEEHCRHFRDVPGAAWGGVRPAAGGPAGTPAAPPLQPPSPAGWQSEAKQRLAGFLARISAMEMEEEVGQDCPGRGLGGVCGGGWAASKRPSPFEYGSAGCWVLGTGYGELDAGCRVCVCVAACRQFSIGCECLLDPKHPARCPKGYQR